MTTITIDGLSEEEFRRSIEGRLRRGRAPEAIAQLRALLEPFAGPGKVLPERFLSVTADDLSLKGWESLGDKVNLYDQPGRPVTALSIAFGWPGEEVPQPDAQGCLPPLIETGYFTDDAFPFSQSGREDLLDGYSLHGCTWADESQASDTTISLEGISDLNGALALLETRLLASEEPDSDEIRAGSLGACLLSSLLYQAVSDRIARDGLPRPLCVMAGSNGVYPYFDAPVVGMPLEILKAAKWAEEEETGHDTGVPGPRYSSLLVAGIRRAPKRAVLVLEESEADMAVRIANLRGLHHTAAETPPPAQPAAAPLPAERLPEAAQAAAPVGPLLAKKTPAQNWDFRDMLSSREPASRLPVEPASEPQPEPGIASRAEPAEAPPPLSSFPLPVEPVAEPGFTSLVEENLQERLHTLLAAHLPERAEPPLAAPEPDESTEAAAPPAPEDEPLPLAAAIPPDQVAIAWPFGLGWLEDAEDAEADQAEAPQIEVLRPGLWARLRRWLGRGE